MAIPFTRIRKVLKKECIKLMNNLRGLCNIEMRKDKKGLISHPLSEGFFFEPRKILMIKNAIFQTYSILFHRYFFILLGKNLRDEDLKEKGSIVPIPTKESI